MPLFLMVFSLLATNQTVSLSAFNQQKVPATRFGNKPQSDLIPQVPQEETVAQRGQGNWIQWSKDQVKALLNEIGQKIGKEIIERYKRDRNIL